MDTATKVAEDLAGLDAEPVVAVITPSVSPKVDDEPDEIEPPSEPTVIVGGKAAETARVLVRVLDQLLVSFNEVRGAAQRLVEVLEQPPAEDEEDADDSEEGTDDGTEVSQSSVA